MADPFVAAVARSFADLQPPARCLVAVSGGADSVALLEALARARTRRSLAQISFVVGHVDHRLRADSALDAACAEAHAARLSLPFALATLDPVPRRNLEETAREARYEALATLARAHACQAVVTAHTATDQAETLLWRLARGAGARGLGGMAPSRALDGLHLLRPLLHRTREETRAFCAAHALAFRDDPTNVDERPRARLRAEVLPVLERLVPNATVHLALAADRLRADDAALAALVPGEAAQGDVRSLRALVPAVRRRALVLWVELQTGTRRRLQSSHLIALEGLILRGKGEVELPASRETRRQAVIRDGRLELDERARDPSVRGGGTGR